MQFLFNNANELVLILSFVFGSGGLLAYFKWQYTPQREFQKVLQNELKDVRHRLDRVEKKASKYQSEAQKANLRAERATDRATRWEKRSKRLEAKVDTLLNMVNDMRIKIDMEKLSRDDIPPIVLEEDD